MSTKLLKYGIGIFMPDAPEGFDAAGLVDVAPERIDIPSGEDAGLVVLETPVGRSSVTITMGSGSKARFVEMSGAARALQVAIELGEGAEAEYLSVGGEGVFEEVRREARLSKDARLRWIDATLAPDFARSANVTVLAGEGATVETTQLFLGDGRQRFDSWTEIRHEAPGTKSDLKVRAVLKGDAKVIARGLVRIEADAPGCAGFQREEALLLSPDAEMDAVPNLEIMNRDVRCGHAAALGRLDQDKLFYLMSRGIARPEAERMLVDAFIAPFLDAVTDLSLRGILEETIAAKLA